MALPVSPVQKKTRRGIPQFSQMVRGKCGITNGITLGFKVLMNSHKLLIYINFIYLYNIQIQNIE